MILFLLFLVLCVQNLVAGLAYNESEVCYDFVGCFNNSAPFNNTNGVLPMSPEELDVRMWLFTRDNMDSHDVLNFSDASNLTASHFDPSKFTKFVIHGFSSSFEKTPWIFQMKNKLLKIGDFNVVAIDWSKGATLPDFPQASANIRVVATEIKLLLELMKDRGQDLTKVHLIGHSLGAHLSGFVGRLMGPNVLGRISGLDPAEPSFKHFTEAVKLDKDDAQFVDVLHTDGSDFNLLEGGFGLKDQTGDVDIYINGGEKQPGCHDGLSGLFSGGNSSLVNSVACSHGRAHDIFLESIDTSCNFTAYPCVSYEKFENGECFSCDSGCSSVGFRADQFTARGIFFVDTPPASPFCGVPYHIKISAATSTPNTTGEIFISLIGELNATEYLPLNPKNTHLNNATVISNNIMYHQDVGLITSVQIKFQRELGFLGSLFSSASTTYTIANIQVLSGSSDLWTSSCDGEFQLKDKTPLTVVTNAGRMLTPCVVIG